jgi:GNAT superfamily N-acetyltransferase
MHIETTMTTLNFHPLSPDLWADFEDLFGPRGACAGCWCVYWKLPRKVFNAGQGDQNRAIQKGIVESGRIPGLIAYVDGIPAGWVAVEPRDQYPVLNNSRILKPLDDRPVWSIPCFFVAKKYRNQGLSVALLKAAIDYVAKKGGKVLEGYPVDPRQPGKVSPAFVYTGLASAFKKAGFSEEGRRSETRPMMRYYIK